MNLFRKAIQNLDAHWRRPSYPLDFKLVREALVGGEELLPLASYNDQGDLLTLYDHLVSVFFPKPVSSNRKATRRASAIVLHTLYLRKGGFVESYQLINTLRVELPGTEPLKDVNELNNLRVRVSNMRTHLQETGWSRKDVKVFQAYGYSISPRLQEAVARAVDTFKASQRPPLSTEQREDAEKIVLGALEPLDDNPAKRICDALAAKGYLTYG
jgi:hypothetical protein